MNVTHTMVTSETFKLISPLIYRQHWPIITVNLYQRDDPLLILHILFPHHGVGLASARLAVSKDAHVVSLEGVQQHFLSDVFVHLHLRGIIDVLWLQTEINNQPIQS